MITIPNPAQATLAGGVVPLVMLAELLYPTPVRACSAAVDVEWNGHTWKGIGPLGEVGEVRDTAGEVTGLRLALSGVPEDVLALALLESARGRKVRLYAAVLSPETHAIQFVRRVFSGEGDQTPIQHEGDQGVVGVNAMHAGAVFGRPRVCRYTDADQQLIAPGDRSLRFVTSQSQVKDVWPAADWGRK